MLKKLVLLALAATSVGSLIAIDVPPPACFPPPCDKVVSVR